MDEECDDPFDTSAFAIPEPTFSAVANSSCEVLSQLSHTDRMISNQQPSMLSQLLSSKEGSALTGASTFDQFVTDHTSYNDQAINERHSEHHYGDHRRAVSSISDAENVSHVQICNT